jgi:hypothetical protein
VVDPGQVGPALALSPVGYAVIVFQGHTGWAHDSRWMGGIQEAKNSAVFSS